MQAQGSAQHPVIYPPTPTHDNLPSQPCQYVQRIDVRQFAPTQRVLGASSSWIDVTAGEGQAGMEEEGERAERVEEDDGRADERRLKPRKSSGTPTAIIRRASASMSALYCMVTGTGRALECLQLRHQRQRSRHPASLPPIRIQRSHEPRCHRVPCLY